MAEVDQKTRHELGALHVVQCEDAREVQVVRPDTCRTAATAVVEPLGEGGQVRSGSEEAVERAFQAEDEGAVVLLPTQEIARSAPANGFHLVEPGLGRDLRVDSDLPESARSTGVKGCVDRRRRLGNGHRQGA